MIAKKNLKFAKDVGFHEVNDSGIAKNVFFDLEQFSLKNDVKRGPWGGQLVKHLILDFGSGHDCRVMGSSPVSSSAQGVEPA